MIDMKIEAAYKAQIDRCKRKVDALGDPVEMRMTLQQFADEWIQSGKWHLRGRKKGQYCMARNNDIGHYEVGNVRIITNSENISEAQKGKSKSEEQKAKMRKPKSEEHKAKMRKPKSEETKAKMKNLIPPSHKGIPWSAKRRAKHEAKKAQKTACFQHLSA